MTLELPGPLVTSGWLDGNLDHPDLRILECTVELKPTDDGLVTVDGGAAWAESHIPNSVYADLADDLSDPDSELRFTMPMAARFAPAMEALGVGTGTKVVLYDRRFTMWATRVFWMLKAFGFDDCAVLDGGWKNWTSEGRPVSDSSAPDRPAVSFEAAPRPERIATLEQLQAAVGDGQTCIINSLSPDNHNGSDGSYGRPGHIPGASNVYAVSLVDSENHRYREPSELASLFDHLPADQPVITYCGGGIAATSDAFVLTELLGRTDVSVYDGSLSEWLLDPDRPLVTEQ